jgi:diguanylate cyclase (GGDEF)-like protein
MYLPDRKILHRLAVLAGSFLILAVPFYYLYSNTDKIVVNEAGKQATGVAIAIANFIEEDQADYLKLIAVDDYSTGNFDQIYYERMLKIFQKIKTDTGADFIFTEKKISNSEIAYILDGEKPGSENFSPIGSTDTLAEAEARAFNEGISISSGLIQDPVWGVYITGFAPIKESTTGRVVSVVGVDFSSGHILRILQSVRNFLVITLVILAVLITILVDRLVENRNKSIRTDFLTGLLSRQYLQRYLPDLIRECKRTDQTFSVMMMDIDSFKEFNDTFGHVCGDKILSAIAHDIQFNIRESDRCFRYGGDEFIAILPNTSPEHALHTAKRIQEYLKRNPVSTDEDEREQRKITLSIGIAGWVNAKNATAVIEQADQAMYISKKEGRDRITLFNPEH